MILHKINITIIQLYFKRGRGSQVATLIAARRPGGKWIRHAYTVTSMYKLGVEPHDQELQSLSRPINRYQLLTLIVLTDLYDSGQQSL